MDTTYGVLCLIPTIVAIGLALWTKQTIFSLFIAVWLGSTMMNGFNPLVGFFMESLLPQLQALSESANHTSSLSRSRDAQNVSLAKSRHGISALNETDHTIYRIFS